MTAYFDALTRHDLDAIAAAWAPDGALPRRRPGRRRRARRRARLLGRAVRRRPRHALRGRRADRRGRPGRRQAGRRPARSPGPGSYQGIEPTYARLDLEGSTSSACATARSCARTPTPTAATFARQIGLLPPSGSTAEQRMTRAFNGQAKLAPARALRDPERIAEGVWLVRGGFPLKTMNVYLIEDAGRRGDDVRGRHQGDVDRASPRPRPRSAASTGSCSATPTPTTAARRRRCRCPTFCHPADRIDAEGDGGRHYFDFSKVSVPGALDAAAAAAGVGRRPGRDRRHRRRGRRRLGLPRRAHPRPRARA